MPGSENYVPRPEQPVFNCTLHKGKDRICLLSEPSIISSTRKGQTAYVLKKQVQGKDGKEVKPGPSSSQQGLRPPSYFEIKISHQVRMKTHTQTSQRNRLAHEIKTQPVGRQTSKRQEAGRHTVLSPDNGTFSTTSPGDSQFQKRALT